MLLINYLYSTNYSTRTIDIMSLLINDTMNIKEIENNHFQKKNQNGINAKNASDKLDHQHQRNDLKHTIDSQKLVLAEQPEKCNPKHKRSSKKSNFNKYAQEDIDSYNQALIDASEEINKQNSLANVVIP